MRKDWRQTSRVGEVQRRVPLVYCDIKEIFNILDWDNNRTFKKFPVYVCTIMSVYQKAEVIAHRPLTSEEYRNVVLFCNVDNIWVSENQLHINRSGSIHLKCPNKDLEKVCQGIAICWYVNMGTEVLAMRLYELMRFAYEKGLKTDKSRL